MQNDRQELVATLMKLLQTLKKPAWHKENHLFISIMIRNSSCLFLIICEVEATQIKSWYKLVAILKQLF